MLETNAFEIPKPKPKCYNKARSFSISCCISAESFFHENVMDFESLYSLRSSLQTVDLFEYLLVRF